MTRWEGDDLRIEVPRVVEAHIRIVGGEVAVTAAAGTGARLEVEVTAGDPARVELEDGILTVVHEPERLGGLLGGLGAINFGNNRMDAAVTLTVPPGTPVTIRTVSAEVVVAGVRSGASVNTVSGSITMNDIAGDVTMRSVSGDLQATAVDGEVTLNTVSGGVTVTGRAPSLTGRSVSGDLTFDLDQAPAASLSTVSGEVVVRLPADAELAFDATTMSGHLDSAFPVTGTSTRRRLAGTVGAGGPEIAVRTMSGDVALLRRETAGASAALAAGDEDGREAQGDR